VVILTPDVMHTWLLGNLSLKPVRSFIRAARLMIIDEVHTFTGVFGGNAAFLFRRFEHALKTMTRKRLQYVCASATIQDAATHLTLLTGRTFTLIYPDRDGSPRHPVHLHFLRPTEPTRDLLSSAASLLRDLGAAGERFICFSDSSKQTENLASILARRSDSDAEETDADDNPLDSSPLAVLPYRSGYEARDRAEIQARLSRGDMDGIISTSALELGMDIPHLDAVVPLGSPADRVRSGWDRGVFCLPNREAAQARELGLPLYSLGSSSHVRCVSPGPSAGHAAHTRNGKHSPVGRHGTLPLTRSSGPIPTRGRAPRRRPRSA
jgi:DEAD/DEAH box helicase domain-containing protein